MELYLCSQKDSSSVAILSMGQIYIKRKQMVLGRNEIRWVDWEKSTHLP